MCLVVFAFPANYRVTIKESEKIDKYLDLESMNMKLVVIQILVCMLGTVSKGLVGFLSLMAYQPL